MQIKTKQIILMKEHLNARSFYYLIRNTLDIMALPIRVGNETICS